MLPYNIKMHYQKTHESLKLKNHYHNGYEMIFVEEGQSQFIINERSELYQAHHLIFINNLEKHEMTPVSLPYTRYFLIINPSLLDSALKDPILMSIFKNRPSSFGHGLCIKSEHMADVQIAFKKCYEEYKNQEKYWEQNIIAILTGLFIFLYRHYSHYFPLNSTSHTARKAIAIQEYIDKYYLDSLTLNSISAVFHLDKYYISHIFKEIIGYSLKQYILLKRLSYAKNLLYYSNDNMTQVAMNSGFNSCSNFIRAFKKHEGITPYQFRKSYK